MKPVNVEYIGAATNLSQCPKEFLPEVAVVGRSNVGKSSLINRLLGRRDMARISSTPGKTRALHFYRVDDRYNLVDLPGYGFARVSREERRKWSAFIEEYLRNRETLRLVILLRDAVVGPMDADERVAEWLRAFDIPVLEVLTKIDKVKRSGRQKAVRAFGAGGGGEAACVVSAKTGEGMDLLTRRVRSAVEADAAP